MLPVWHEQYAGCQSIQTVAKGDAVLVCLASKDSLNLSLTAVLILQVVSAIRARLQIESLYQVGPVAEDAIQRPVCDVGTGHVVCIEAQAITLYLVHAHRQRRGELSQESVY